MKILLYYFWSYSWLSGGPEDKISSSVRQGVKGVAASAAELGRWSAERGRQLLLVNLLHPRRGAYGVSFFRAYRDDLKGLVLGSALALGIVFFMWLILQL
jgi:hypothetical protein